MQSRGGSDLEQALANTEADAIATLKVANTLIASLRKFYNAAKTGSLQELRSTVETTEKALASLRQQFTNAKEGWDFDEDSYFTGGFYTSEIISLGKQTGVNIFEHDDYLYCYPVLIRVSPNDKAVFIDKKRESRIRPSVLLTRLKELQRKPARFRPESFLETLFKAYHIASATRQKEFSQTAPVIPLKEIYELLTLLPGQTKEYSKQEFIRDVYLLHKSDADTTKSGARVRFPVSTATRNPSKILTMINEAGEEKSYYGISFTESSRE